MSVFSSDVVLIYSTDTVAAGGGYAFHFGRLTSLFEASRLPCSAAF